MAEPRILCVAYGGGHIRACLPALVELRERGWHIDLLALTTAFEEARAAGFDVWRVRDLLEPSDDVMVAQGAHLASVFPESEVVPHDETVAYLAFGYHDLVLAHGSERAAEIYDTEGRFAFTPHTLAERMIDRARPDLVLTTNSPRAEKAAIDVAQRRGIPAIVLNDLVASDTNYWLHDPEYADRIFVLNEYVRSRLVSSGHMPGKIVVTGNPAFEPMVAMREKASSRSVYGRRRVLYASQPLPGVDSDHGRRMRTKLHEISCRRTDWEVRVRLHPNEADGTWVQRPLRLSTEAELLDDLVAADVVITHGSTVGLQAAIAGVSTILQLGSSVSAAVPYDKMGIAIPAPNLDSLESAIERAVTTEASVSVAMPDKPTQRVADAIEEFLNAI